MEIPQAVLVGIISAVATLIGTWLTLRRSRSSLKQTIDRQIDQRVQEELKRQADEISALKRQAEKSTRRDRAIGNVLYALANQWPVGASRPVLDPRDLLVLDDMIPPQWRSGKEAS